MISGDILPTRVTIKPQRLACTFKEKGDTMTIDVSTRPPCDPEILKNGEVVLALQCGSDVIGTWVKHVAERADAKLDWHYIEGVAYILHFGDEHSRLRVLNAMSCLWLDHPGNIVFSQRG